MRTIAFTVIAVLGSALMAVAADTTVATVAGHTITQSELEQHVKPKLIEIDNERYETLSQGLDEMVTDILLEQEAKARGISKDDLVEKEVESKIPEPTDAEVQKLYDDNKDQLNGASLDSVKPRIVQYLKQQKGAAVAQTYIAGLKKKYKTTVLLHPPVVEVGTGPRPPRGGANAAVTIVTFSDYECPFCKRAESTVDQVMKAYGDKVRLYFRDYPLPFHQHARPAAEAAECANAQGKFWDYHDKLMASKDLSPENLKKMAADTGMDAKKFDECVAKNPYKDIIEKDIADGATAGVNGTPAFFINGRLISGAQPFEKFKEIIDEELARK